MREMTRRNEFFAPPCSKKYSVHICSALMKLTLMLFSEATEECTRVADVAKNILLICLQVPVSERSVWRQRDSSSRFFAIVDIGVLSSYFTHEEAHKQTSTKHFQREERDSLPLSTVCPPPRQNPSLTPFFPAVGTKVRRTPVTSIARRKGTLRHAWHRDPPTSKANQPETIKKYVHDSRYKRGFRVRSRDRGRD